MHPYLDSKDVQTIARISTMFARRVQKGEQGRPVGAGTVQAALGGINMTISLETGKQTLHQIDGKNYIKPIQHMLVGFKNFEPLVEKNLAVHLDLPKFAAAYGNKPGAGEYRKAMGDLVLIVFYYLLRICEYTTKTRRKKKTRTCQFRENNVTLFKLNTEGELRALPHNTSLEEVMTADAATPQISNQKNGHKGACVHHMENMRHPKECPVRALGRRIVHIRKYLKSGKAFLYSYWDKVGRGSVTDSDIRLAVKYAVGCLDYPGRGIPLI